MATTIGSGLGGFTAIAVQPTYGGNFVTPTRVPIFKSNKATYNPHIVQGGPYLRNGAFVDIGSAHIDTWLDATGTIMGDVTSTAFAQLLQMALGSSAALTQIGTTTAYGLGGLSGFTLGCPDQNNGGSGGCCFDMQLGVPLTSGVQQPENYHSCVITKAEFVFDRTGLVTYSMDWDAQYVEKNTAIISPSEPNAPVPFSMANASSFFKAGTYGAETQIDGIRKATITLERHMDVERIYLGNQYKELPITNALVDITVALDTDYTSAAKTALFDLFLAGTATSVVVSSVGGAIGSSGVNNTFQLNASNLFVQTGGESPLDGPDLVKNTITLKGTIDAANDPALKGLLYTADTAL